MCKSAGYKMTKKNVKNMENYKKKIDEVLLTMWH